MYTRWFGHADPALIADRIDRYNRLAADGHTVDEEMRAAVLFAAARVPVAVVSAAARSEIDPVVDAAGIRDALDPDRLARRRLERQARPRVLPDCGARARRRPAELLVFEDTDVGVAAAKAAGTRVVGLTRTLGPERLAAADELVERIDIPLLERLLCS